MLCRRKHTNTIERFWAIACILWTGSSLYKKIYALYIAEATFKYNNRKNNPVFNNIFGGLQIGL